MSDRIEFADVGASCKNPFAVSDGKDVLDVTGGLVGWGTTWSGFGVMWG